MVESKDYHYRRDPMGDPFSVEGTETGYLLRLLIKDSIGKDYQKLIVEELKVRGFTDEEINKYSEV